MGAWKISDWFSLAITTALAPAKGKVDNNGLSQSFNMVWRGVRDTLLFQPFQPQPVYQYVNCLYITHTKQVVLVKRKSKWSFTTIIYLRWKTKFSEPVYKDTIEIVKENSAIYHISNFELRGLILTSTICEKCQSCTASVRQRFKEWISIILQIKILINTTPRGPTHIF